MPDVRLVEVDEFNYEECLALAVRDDQRKHNWTPVQVLAHAYAVRWLTARAIAWDDAGVERLVGMALFGPNPYRQVVWITEFFIDRRYQRRGLGTAALQFLVKKLQGLYDTGLPIVANVDWQNEPALRFYQRNGFRAQEMQAFGKPVKYMVWSQDGTG